MVRKLFLFCSLMLLAGCRQLPPRVIYKSTPYPVFITPAVHHVDKPILYTQQIKNPAVLTLGQKIQGLYIDIQQLIAYSTQLEKVVAQYNQLSILFPSVGFQAPPHLTLSQYIKKLKIMNLLNSSDTINNSNNIPFYEIKPSTN